MNPDNRHCLISIFMPVYNGSRYLKESIESILKQTLKDFELICVDDSSTDNSYEILKEFASKDSRIKVFQKPNGGNVPKSWNYIMPHLQGDSITYMSQDDLMSEDNLEKMYLRQQETGADCILPDMVYYFEGKQENKRLAGVNGNRDIILSNRQSVILSLNDKIHGFALWRSKIIKDEIFPEDSFNSDEYMCQIFFFKSNRVAFCSGVFFYRQDNENAITSTFGMKNYYMILKHIRIYKFLEENNFDSNILASLLYKIYTLHFSTYRSCSLRKAINSEFEFKKVRIMLSDIFLQFNNEKLSILCKYGKGFNRLKIYTIRILYYDFKIFQIIMTIIWLIDRKNKIMRIK